MPAWNDILHNRRLHAIGAAVAVLAVVALVYFNISGAIRKPPSIFDTPADDVLVYLAQEDFSKLSLEERLAFIQGLVQRFAKMQQSESVVVSSFLAGLTGPASEKLVDNARRLGKDIFVQGAAEYLALKTQAERDAYLDQWIIKWLRFGEEATGRTAGRTDDQELDRLGQQARRDLQRGIEIDAETANRIADFWERDVLSVSSPVEQAQIYQFGPALRQRILSRGSKK